MSNNAISLNPQTSVINALSLVGIAGTVLSLALVFMNMIDERHASFNTTSDGIVWGLPVATYVFFVLTSTGLTFVASFGMVFGIKEFLPLAKRCIWLAFATLVAGFTALAFELGHPFRMLWALPTSFQIVSPMNWMGVLYLAYVVFLLLKFQKIHAGDWDSSASKKLGIASFIAVTLAHATLGSVFGMMAMRPFWFDGLMPVYFLLTALLSGIAFAVLMTYIAYGGRREAMPEPLQNLLKGTTPTLYASMPVVFSTVLGVTLVALAARTVTGVWSHQDGFQAFDWMVSSPWFAIEAIGMVVAFFLMVSPRTRSEVGVQLLSSALVLLGLFIGRYEFVIGGQVVPVFKGNWVLDFIEYTPSLTEWMLLVLPLSLCLAIYAVGEKKLQLGAMPER
ncbi:MAG: polysulfide reductase NrfD [Rhodocyclaceae bacterium]|nr:polysulfide reductase NrfD [Rhodocyclaceae bacterium]